MVGGEAARDLGEPVQELGVLLEDRRIRDVPAAVDEAEVELVEKEQVSEQGERRQRRARQRPEGPVDLRQPEHEEDGQPDEAPPAEGDPGVPVPGDRVDVGLEREEEDERPAEPRLAAGEDEEAGGGEDEERVPAEEAVEGGEEGGEDLGPVPDQEVFPLGDGQPLAERDPPVDELRGGAGADAGQEDGEAPESGERAEGPRPRRCRRARRRPAQGQGAESQLAPPGEEPGQRAGGEIPAHLGERQGEEEDVLPPHHRRDPGQEAEGELVREPAAAPGAVPDEDE